MSDGRRGSPAPYTAFVGYYGHSSGPWFLFLIPFAIVILVRVMGGSNRQRQGRPPGQSSFFSGPPSAPPHASHPSPPTSAPRGEPAQAGTTAGGGTPAGWFRDPFVRHEQRYWSGGEWTDHCLDGGVPSNDPPPNSSRPAEDS